jgi:hypothetical protein
MSRPPRRERIARRLHVLLQISAAFLVIGVLCAAMITASAFLGWRIAAPLVGLVAWSAVSFVVIEPHFGGPLGTTEATNWAVAAWTTASLMFLAIAVLASLLHSAVFLLSALVLSGSSLALSIVLDEQARRRLAEVKSIALVVLGTFVLRGTGGRSRLGRRLQTRGASMRDALYQHEEIEDVN